MKRHTNVAQLVIASTNILQATGRLMEHELWSDDKFNRTMIERELLSHANDIAEWFGCKLVKADNVEEAA